MVDVLLSLLRQKCISDKLGSIILTGGRAANRLYQAWNIDSTFNEIENTRLFFSDERCVSTDHVESNYKMVVDALAGASILGNIERIRGESEFPVSEAIRYGLLLPDTVDLLLLSVGEDGHIASLFPGSHVLTSHEKMAFVDDVPKLPSERITITPRVILSAKEVIVMAAGSVKGGVLAAALNEPERISELPVRLTVGSTWVLDQSAADSFQRCAPSNFCDTRIIYA